MAEPLRLALLMHSVLPRGGVVHTLELADALHARGHAVTVIAPVEPGQRPFRTPRCALRLLPLPTPQGPLVEQVRQRIDGLVHALAPLLADGRHDLLHAQDSLNGNALATLRDAGCGLPPWLRTVHHLDDFADAALRAWQQRGWQAADAIGCVSAGWCERFERDLGRRAERLHNGVDLGRYTPAPGADDARVLAALGLAGGADTRLCLAIGGVEERKNSVRLLEAFARLRRSDPAWADARLLVAGGASLLDHRAEHRRWDAALAALGWREGPEQPVWRCGPLPDAALPPLLRRAALLALPSLVEGFGLVALEALACGTPVLVSRRAPFTEHLADCAAVAWCEPEDIDSIADGLRAAALLPRRATPPPVCIAHGWARSAAGHEAWYRRVLAQRRLTAASELLHC